MTLMILGIIAVALGLTLLLPPRGSFAQFLGAGFLIVGVFILAGFGANFVGLSLTNDQALFWSLAIVTIASAVCTVTSQNPVFSALWFGLSLLGTSGLFMFLGAQFLAVATVVVYAGAILVTFLFVLMLATPSGQAGYDRISWERLLSATTAAVLVGVLTSMLGRVQVESDRLDTAALEPVATARATEIDAPAHVAHLGRELFTTQLLTVQAAGVLLFVGLVGAAVIVAHGRQRDHRERRLAQAAARG